MANASKLVFEVSWETVNKVGGIHTVVRSKAAETVSELGSAFIMIGPYNSTEAQTEVQFQDSNIYEVESSLEAMRSQGIKVYVGTWIVPGNPTVVLFDIMSGYSHLDNWRLELKEKSNICVSPVNKELSDSIVFGGLVAWFFSEVRRHAIPSMVMLAHFHEWIASVGLIFSKSWNIDVGLILTTHATLMGRHLSAGGSDLYNSLKRFNCDEECGKKGIYPQYCIERAACHCAHVFTTVSDITAEEADAFLGRWPDIITPNGLHIRNYVALHDFQNLHVVCKEVINEFVRGHFFGSYHFDLDKVIYLFSAGRYEYTNKGVDILLEAASRLNTLLKIREIDVTVVLFLIFQGKTNNYNVESLKSQATLRQLRKTIHSIQDSIGSRIFDTVVSGRIPESNELLQNKDVFELKKFLMLSRNANSLPPIVTHNMIDDANDPILCTCRRLQLFNSPDDKVKIVFHPNFLTSTNPLFPIDYENFVRGCHLGVFPSYYEPWGYTPAECTSWGIPSVTTNLSGFGRFVEDHVAYPTDYGIYIIDRRGRSLEDSINQLTNYLFIFAKQSRRERIMQRNRCERLCEILDWKKLNANYSRARLMALERTHPDKLCLLKSPHYEHSTFFKIGFNGFMSPRHSEPCSEDEYPHLWGNNIHANNCP